MYINKLQVMVILCMALMGNGVFLFSVCKRFVQIRDKRWASPLLFLALMLTSGMVIWIGDNNFAMTFPFYMAAFLIATKGDWLGRVTIGSILFCFIMAVCAMADTYFVPLNSYGVYDLACRLVRPIAFGLFYLLFRRHLPKAGIQLPHHLWKLCAGLTSLPLAVLAVLILPAYWMPESVLLHDLNWFQGTIILPMALFVSLLLLRSILVLADYEKKAQEAALAEMREVYYQSLQREQNQVRTLRHDLRNHLNAALGLLERKETEKARRYLLELTDSEALGCSARLCDHEIANVVLLTKREEMARENIPADISVSLPADLPITDTDLCALLGNALDNAIEASRKAENRQIRVRCKAERGLFMLRVENCLAGDEHADLSTTKKNKELHGLGLRGMREIAARYGGVLETETANGKFELLVSFPLAGQDTIPTI